MSKRMYTHNSDKKRHVSARQKQKILIRKMLFILCCVVVFLILYTIVKIVRVYSKPISIELKLDNAEISQGEALPAFKASAIYQGKKKDKVIDKAKDITVQDLLDELNSGKGYTLSCDADTSVDNTYPVKIMLDKSLKSKLEGDWGKKLNINISEGKLVVKNTQGIWDGDKFKLNDGSYLTNDFLTSRGKTYFFNEEGKKVTGDHQIGLKVCTFSKKGELVSKQDAVVQPDKPMIALTFDDGPGERTSELLDVLDKYNAHATFFMQGKNIPHYPDVIKKMKDTGNELGNHSYNHPELTKLSAADIQKQISDTNTALQEVCEEPATVLRPPYGSINDNVSANVGLPMILWTIDTLDWKTLDPQATFDTTIASATDGAIALMHDIHSTSVDAAIRIIPELTKQGYQLVTMSEMSAAKGIPMENGKTYRDDF